MCLIVLDWQPTQADWLLLVANRDEFHARPTAAMAPWPDQPHILAGRDLQQGGSWLGINRSERFAALTNVRDGHAGPEVDKRSRGELVCDYLNSDATPQQFAEQLHASADRYGRFNLLVGNRHTLWYICNWPHFTARPVAPGLQVLSNAHLNSDWPKARQALNQLWQQRQQGTRSPSQLLNHVLSDPRRWPDSHLPDTGVPLAWEQLLSAQKIISPEYGTRCSTVVQGSDDGVALCEQSWNSDGSVAESQHWQLRDGVFEESISSRNPLSQKSVDKTPSSSR
ncbi:NRDE family protein [Oceanobacter kriegii]|uniref:NRDE family protein n=1 Tax=Oceanobacter kriegii TaxID=64972 RepID=UPI000407F675|nr:NRDE family protein [Oceanobacter kriegii]